MLAEENLGSAVKVCCHLPCYLLQCGPWRAWSRLAWAAETGFLSVQVSTQVQGRWQPWELTCAEAAEKPPSFCLNCGVWLLCHWSPLPWTAAQSAKPEPGHRCVVIVLRGPRLVCVCVVFCCSPFCWAPSPCDSALCASACPAASGSASAPPSPAGPLSGSLLASGSPRSLTWSPLPPPSTRTDWPELLPTCYCNNVPLRRWFLWCWNFPQTYYRNKKIFSTHLMSYHWQTHLILLHPIVPDAR